MGMQTEATKPRPTLWPEHNLSVREARTHDSSHAELQSSLAREKVLREQVEEFEHRLFNSVQMIVSLLASQSRASSPEVAEQLTIAINRIIAFGHVHRRLHLLDRGRTVQFGPFLQQLCTDLSGVFSIDPLAQAIVTESVDLELPTALGGELGFIISELVTNSAKHGKGTSRFNCNRPRRRVIRYPYLTMVPAFRKVSSLEPARVLECRSCLPSCGGSAANFIVRAERMAGVRGSR